MSKKFEKKITTTIEISQKNIVFFFIAIASVYVLYLLKDLVLGLFISILFSTALNPLVSKIESLKVPRSIAAALVYFLIIAFITISVGTIVPTLVVQTLNLMNSLPLQTVSQQLNLFEVNLENIQLISNQVGSVIPVIKVIGSTFSGIITIFTFLVITFYLLIERKKLHKYIAKLFADGDAEQKAEKLISKVEAQIGGWVRGESILMIIVGLITYIGLRLLNVPFALPLAILAGVLEIVPNIGPTISAIPAIIVPIIAGQNPFTSIFVIALYIIIQQVENNFIVPKVMHTAVGIHPLVTIILIISGLKLSGVSGAILAVPIFLVLKVLFTELYLNRGK